MMDAGKCTLSDEAFEASRFPGNIYPDMKSKKFLFDETAPYNCFDMRG